MTAFKDLKKQYIRLDKEEHDLEFLRICKDLGVIPKFLSTKSRFIATNFTRDKFQFEFRCLKNYIRRKFAIIDRIQKTIYGTRNDGLYYSFSVSCNSTDFDLAMKKLFTFRQGLQQDLQTKLSSKMRDFPGFNRRSEPRRNSFNFLNLSTHSFTDREMRLLNKGPKYICNSSTKPVDMIPQFEDVINNIKPEGKEEVRSFIFQLYKKYSKSLENVPLTDLRLMKSLKKHHDIVFLSTDKSNRLAVMQKTDYVNKMTQVIQDIGCVPVQNDPLNSFIAKLTKIVRFGAWPENIKNLVKLNNLGVIPYIFGVVKDHKPTNPLRPIVSRNLSPAYYIEKALVVFLKDYLPPSSYVLSSTRNFVDKLRDINLPNNFIMATLDIVSLYPSIDVNKARDNIVLQLNSDSNLSTSIKTTVISAINLVITSNFFRFNGNIFKQNTGAPMGSPLSGLFAEFILRPFEEQFLLQSIFQPICWLRYVDDIFVLWPYSSNDFLLFCQELNNVDQTLKFTWEIERDNMLSYMDVSLKKQGSEIIRSIYRKPFNSLNTIPSHSAAPRSYKLSAFRSFIHRALNVCSQETIHQELNIIRNIAVNNGYSLNIINELIIKIVHPPSNQHTASTNLNPPIRVPITYIPGFHEKTNNFLKAFNVHLTAKTHPKMKDFLRTKLDPLPPLQIPGVYEIPFTLSDGSTQYYIGLTSRKFTTRLKEHQGDLRNGRLTTALSRTYFNDTTIQIRFNEAKIVAPFINRYQSTIRESLEIHTRSNSVCNEQDSFRIPAIWLSLL